MVTNNNLSTSTTQRSAQDRWVKKALIAAAALVIAAPILALTLGALSSSSAQGHIWSTTGPRYLGGTIALCILVAIGATIIGTGSAILVALTDFPGRRFFSIALALPFAIPAYVAAYAYGDFMGPFGAVAALVGASATPEIRSLPGAAFILTLMTYPYVYLAMRASLAGRSAAYLEAARTLGAGPRKAALAILVPIGRPALAGGLALALMETAADYGVADYYGVSTLSVGVFRTWFGLGDLTAATQIAAGLFFVALLLVIIEEAARRGRSTESVRALRSRASLKLSRRHSALAIAACAAPVILGFALPVFVFLSKLDFTASTGAARGLYQAIANTGMMASAGAAIVAALALILAYTARRAHGPATKILIRIATLGYAIPGAVIAIGILSLTAGLERLTGAGVAAGAGVLLYAYTARFLTVGYNAAAGGLAQISPQMDAAAQALGAGVGRVFKDIHWPQARGAILTGGAIVFIDIAKELPATLLLRPFNFETLATHIYRLASDERLSDAAPGALILIGLGLAPTIALSLIGRQKPSRK